MTSTFGGRFQDYLWRLFFLYSCEERYRHVAPSSFVNFYCFVVALVSRTFVEKRKLSACGSLIWNPAVFKNLFVEVFI